MHAEPGSYDVVVIGSGPGGYVCAVRAAQLGLRTAIVEQDAELGGTCLNRGCIPTKALLHAADVYGEIQQAASYGIIAGDAHVDMEKLHQYRKRVVLKNARGVAYLMKKNGVDVYHGRGRLAGAGRVAVDDGDGGAPQVLSGRHVVLACGSAPSTVPGFEFDGQRVISSNEALALDHVPESMVVLGAGAVGVEFASIYSRLGARVTLVELLPRILPLEDEEISRELERALRKQGVTVTTGTRAAGLERGEGRLTVVTRDAAGAGAGTAGGGDGGGDGGGAGGSGGNGGNEQHLECELLLVAVGRGPVSDGLGLAEAGVVLEKGYVRVDEHLRTSAPGIFALGDLVRLPDRAHPQLAHVASHEGILVAETIAGRDPAPLDYDQVPGCTYCHPEVASVGLTEAEARARGHDLRIGKFPFSANSKSSVLLETIGFVKIVAEARYDEVLGVHIIGPHATDLIAEAVAALRLESTSAELARVIHPHPTLSEALGEAAHGVLGAPIHI